MQLTYYNSNIFGKNFLNLDYAPKFRWDIINFLIKKISAKKYLEIGVYSGKNFERINCEYKVGVDPYVQSKATIFKTSDDFFETNNEKFDVIFIDGLHLSDQVYRDINNSLDVLNDGGYIVCHDINPENEITQIVPAVTGKWTGDCWKAWVKLRTERSDLLMFVVDTDCGCGVIRKGTQDILNINNDELYTYKFLNNNRKLLLNLINPNQFLNYI